MPRILVADDNSNIQKMVGLALKDQGIDVVAVGNGEAAVRKISDVRPDLVLADVFMPVRNGYEVCKYVKDDSSLAHIPVILLVGAFDPLDEQEAQRVGADGVLKKPFVPPDPLISMVKSALQRSANLAPATAAAERGTSAMIGGPASTSGPNATVIASGPATVFAVPQAASPSEGDSLAEEIPAKTEALKIESSGKPLAFGSLLETRATETEDDTAFVTPANPELIDRNWNSGEEEEEEEEEEESSSSSWRRDGGSEDFAPEPGAETETEKAAARSKKRETWTPTREKLQDLLEDAVEPEAVTSMPPPAVGVGNEAASPQNSWPAPELVESKAASQAEPEAAAKVEAPVLTETALPEPAKVNGANSWFSTTSSPWEAEVQKATQLASTWDVPTVPSPTNGVQEAIAEPPVAGEQPEPAAEPEATAQPSYDFVSEAPSEEPVHYVPDPGLVGNEVVAHNPLPELISDGSISPETVETIRQDTIYALESVTQPAAAEPAAAAEKIPDVSQQDMDSLVANVLAKMSPEMLQAVTREILKPVVAAMIRDEINAKKS